MGIEVAPNSGPHVTTSLVPNVPAANAKQRGGWDTGLTLSGSGRTSSIERYPKASYRYIR